MMSTNNLITWQNCTRQIYTVILLIKSCQQGIKIQAQMMSRKTELQKQEQRWNKFEMSVDLDEKCGWMNL